jgi:DNA-binding CsgD family transcriptional regulator
VARHGWSDVFLAGPAWDRALGAEIAAARASSGPPPLGPARRGSAVALLLAGVLTAVVAVFGLLGGRRWLQRRRGSVDRVKAVLTAPATEPQTAVQNVVVNRILDEFRDWSLSAAESDIAWLILKGMSLKEIAELRGTSERTVRHQAQAVYGKAGVDGRADLAGHILNRCMSDIA